MNKLSIKHKLGLLVALVMLPLIGAQMHMLANQVKKIVALEMNTNQDYAESVAHTFNNYVVRIWNDQLIIGNVLVKNLAWSSEDKNEYLIKNNFPNSTIKDIYWVDSPRGVITASTNQAALGISIQDRDYYRRLLAGESRVLSGLLESRLNQEDATFVVASAIREYEALLGVIVYIIAVEELNHIMPPQRVGQGNTFGLIDNRGVIAYRNGIPDIARQWHVIPEDSPPMVAMQERRMVQFENVRSELTNKRQLGVVLPIYKTGWVAYAITDYDYILAKGLQDIRVNLLVMLITGAISLTLARIICRRILEPIGKLQQFAQQFARGDLTARTSILGQDELAATGVVLNHMAEQVQQLEASRRRFIQASAHELRNPMTVIQGIVTLMRRRRAMGKPIENEDKLMLAVEKEVDRLSRLLNQILEAFRTSQGGINKLELKLEQINLGQLVQETGDSFQLGQEEKAISVELKGHQQVMIIGDPDRLEDVLRNLLSNAHKYAPNAPIQVSLEVGQDKMATVSVADRGIGIPDHQMAEVFQCFFRGDNIKAQDPGGMGLGLYICRDIIVSHGGAIWAENNPGQGCTFYFKLPLANN